MKRLLAALLVLGPVCAGPFIPACSKNAASDSDAATDASVDEGTSSIYVPTDGEIIDGAPPTNFEGGAVRDGGDIDGYALAPLSCTSNADCTMIPGQVCGYSATGGCDAGNDSGAFQGYCILFSPPENTSGVVQSACGCNGQTVLYVYAGTTQYPVASPVPCVVDAGPVDAAADASDAATPLDASVDASSSAVLGCVNSGGTVGVADCCNGAGSFPDTCTVGSCSCPPSFSTDTAVCQCPTGMCFSASAAKCVDEQ